MKVRAIVEWKGGEVGWRGSASVPNKGEVTVNSGHSSMVVRKRLRRALIEVGLRDPDLDVELRIPSAYHKDLQALEQARKKVGRVNAEFNEERLRVARRLLTELNMNEREVAALLGISSTHLGNLLKAQTVDTDKFRIKTTQALKPGSKKKQAR